MKNRQQHTVPLGAAAVELLLGLPREGDFVFVGMQKGAPLSAPAMAQVLARLGYGEIATPHGLRSSFRDWGAERSHFPREVLELALAHTVGAASGAARRLFGKRRLLTWAKYATSPPAGRCRAKAGQRDREPQIGYGALEAGARAYNAATAEASWRWAIFMDEARQATNF
jgi:hypothetical protein